MMRAGFSKIKITPPVGTKMMGWQGRDRDHGCERIHDDLFTRVLYLQHGDEEVLIAGFDLLFFTRATVDRYKGAVGRKLDLAPRQMLFNTSHTHVGPATALWGQGSSDAPPDPCYLDTIEKALVEAACEAKASAREGTVWGGTVTCDLPINRRLMRSGVVEFRPNPQGPIDDKVPICVFKDLEGRTVSVLFSVACHPSMIGGFEVSAEYPGVAMRCVDEFCGAEVSLFLQGAGGDSKPRVTVDPEKASWRKATWEDVESAGRMVARPIIACLQGGLRQCNPALRAALIDMEWPLGRAPSLDEFRTIAEEASGDACKRHWAVANVKRLERGEALPATVQVAAHGIQLAKGVRIVGLEGEAVAELGHLIRGSYPKGDTFALGYTDGTQLYLPTESMLAEGGYEVASYYEYSLPAPLVPGFERILRNTMRQLKAGGIE